MASTLSRPSAVDAGLREKLVATRLVRWIQRGGPAPAPLLVIPLPRKAGRERPAGPPAEGMPEPKSGSRAGTEPNAATKPNAARGPNLQQPVGLVLRDLSRAQRLINGIAASIHRGGLEIGRRHVLRLSNRPNRRSRRHLLTQGVRGHAQGPRRTREGRDLQAAHDVGRDTDPARASPWSTGTHPRPSPRTKPRCRGLRHDHARPEQR